MRVTSNSFTNEWVQQLGALAQQQAQLQSQAATGKRITLPEDDPAAMSQVLDLQTESSSVVQYKSNIQSQQQVGLASYGVMQSLKTISDRAGEISTLADDLKSPSELNAYATEVTQLIRQAAELVNGKFNGNYLFGGTNTNHPPFVLTDASDGTVANVAYTGNTTLPETEVDEGVTLTSQTLGANETGTGPRGLITDSRVGADFFSHLISLQSHLTAGDTTTIASTDRAQLASDEDNLLYHISANGVMQSRLDVSTSRAQSRSTTLQKNVSGLADADLAQTLTRLSQTQTAYQAALQTGASVLKLSLLDYLR